MPAGTIHSHLCPVIGEYSGGSSDLNLTADREIQRVTDAETLGCDESSAGELYRAGRPTANCGANRLGGCRAAVCVSDEIERVVRLADVPRDDRAQEGDYAENLIGT